MFQYIIQRHYLKSCIKYVLLQTALEGRRVFIPLLDYHKWSDHQSTLILLIRTVCDLFTSKSLDRFRKETACILKKRQRIPVGFLSQLRDIT